VRSSRLLFGLSISKKTIAHSSIFYILDSFKYESATTYAYFSISKLVAVDQ
jgi:cytochrome oxidase Cu insertion factor (SCO1/SenC/PrrC family)